MRCKECVFYHKENNTCQSKKCACVNEGRITWIDILFCKPCKANDKEMAGDTNENLG